MSLIVIQHQTSEVTGRLGQVLQEFGHKVRTIRPDRGDPMPDLDEVDGVVAMGGEMNVGDTAAHPWIENELAFIRSVHEANLPFVGVCLGAQMLAAALGGEVGAMDKPEIGWHNVKLSFFGTVDPIYAGITWDAMQFHIHGQEVTKLPPGGSPLAGSAACRTQAFRVGLRSYGFQYHFECDRELIRAFAACSYAAKNGINMDAIMAETEKHYDGYQRQSQRLCERIALILLPVDKR